MPLGSDLIPHSDFIGVELAKNLSQLLNKLQRNIILQLLFMHLMHIKNQISNGPMISTILVVILHFGSSGQFAFNLSSSFASLMEIREGKSFEYDSTDPKKTFPVDMRK
jgi:hypothetical protein